MVVLKQHS